MLPIVRLLTVVVSTLAPEVASIHDNDDNPKQEPLKTWNTTSDIDPGVTVITCDVYVATKENQTSSSAPVPAHATEDCVAPTLLAVVVDVHIDAPFTVTDVALEQSLFVGGLKLAVDATQELVNPPQLLCTYKVYEVCWVNPFAVADVVPVATEPEAASPVAPLPPAPDDLSSQL